MGDHYAAAEERYDEMQATKKMADILARQAARPVLRPAPRKPSQVERIRALSEERGLGLMEAKRIVLREDLLADIRKAHTIGDIKDLLVRMVG